MALLQAFEIEHEGKPIGVAEHRLPSGRVFHIDFLEQSVKPLVITVAETDKGKKYWTSMPEGRQGEAEKVGKLVANYIRGNR